MRELNIDMYGSNKTTYFFCCLTLLALAGCAKQGPKGGPRQETVPLSGTVSVDGKPEKGIAVSCHPQEEGSGKRVLSGSTDETGKVIVSTYTAGDGVPPGNYNLTFKWLKKGKGLGKAKDIFKGRYADPKKSKFKIDAKQGEPTEFDEIKLTTN